MELGQIMPTTEIPELRSWNCVQLKISFSPPQNCHWQEHTLGLFHFNVTESNAMCGSCFFPPWCNCGWDGQPDFALLNRQLREVGQPHLLRIIWRSGFCETFFANSHPSSSSRRKMSKFDLKDVRSLLGEQDWSLLLLQSFLILSLCFVLFLNLSISDGT